MCTYYSYIKRASFAGTHNRFAAGPRRPIIRASIHDRSLAKNARGETWRLRSRSLASRAILKRSSELAAPAGTRPAGLGPALECGGGAPAFSSASMLRALDCSRSGFASASASAPSNAPRSADSACVPRSDSGPDAGFERCCNAAAASTPRRPPRSCRGRPRGS